MKTARAWLIGTAETVAQISEDVETLMRPSFDRLTGGAVPVGPIRRVTEPDVEWLRIMNGRDPAGAVLAEADFDDEVYETSRLDFAAS